MPSLDPRTETDGRGSKLEHPDFPELHRMRKQAEVYLAERNVLLCVLRNLRKRVVEGGVPRYTVTPGAALNALIEEEIDPVLKSFEGVNL